MGEREVEGEKGRESMKENERGMRKALKYTFYFFAA